jgi:proteasome-associated ATPase
MKEDSMPDIDTAGQLRNLLTARLSPEEERALVNAILKDDPSLAPQLTHLYVQHKLRLQASIHDMTHAHTRLQESLKQRNWVQSILLAIVPGTPARALVAQGHRRLLAGIHPDIDESCLHRGRVVYINEEHNCLVHAGLAGLLPGTIGTFVEMIGERAMVQGTQDERSLMDVLDLSLIEQLQPGDHVSYLPDSRLVLERIVRMPHSIHGAQLEEAPSITFDRIGGLDEIVEQLTQEIRLHTFHRDVVAGHQLPFRKGLLLYGPPGCGKTLLAKAIARYVADLEGVEGRFLTVKAGSHRSMWYGQSEEHLREIFSLARHAAAAGQFVTMLFDDFDHFGSRDAAGHEIDARILPALLHEVDDLQSISNIFLIGVTNRPDLLDEALLRPGRFGDRTFAVPRPDRAAAEAILRVHLPTSLPYEIDGATEAHPRDMLIARTLSRVYAPNGAMAHVGYLTFRDGSRKPLTAAQLMSGALLSNAVTEAKRRSCIRTLQGTPPGLTQDDLQDAMDRELVGLASRLKPGAGLKHLLDLANDLDVVKIEITVTVPSRQQDSWLHTDNVPLTV